MTTGWLGGGRVLGLEDTGLWKVPWKGMDGPLWKTWAKRKSLRSQELLGLRPALPFPSWKPGGESQHPSAAPLLHLEEAVARQPASRGCLGTWERGQT